MSDNNQKENKENLSTKFLKAIHEYYIFSFIILFGLSIIIFAALYFCHSKNIENRFDNTLQNYEKSMSDIFNNIITNGINENIYTNSFQTNNNQLQNDSIEKLKLSFEVGFKMLESSMNEIMKNSNDVLQFWFAFLSVIMIVFTLIGFFVSSNILNQAREQLRMVEKEAKAKSDELIENITSKSDEETKKLIQKLESEYNQTIEKFKDKTEKENSELIENIKIKSNEETERLIKELEAKYNNAVEGINKTREEESKKLTEESDLFNKGLQAYNNGDYQSSIYYFNEVIKLNSKNYQAYNNRGIAKSNLAKTKEKNSKEYNELMKEAMHDYNKAIELNPNLSEAYYNRGNAKRKLQKVEEAIEDYNEAIRLNPNYSGAYNNRGIAKAELKLFEEAIEDFNKAIELNPNYSMAYNNRGKSKYDLANTKEKNSEECNKLINESIYYYGKAIEIDNKNSMAYNNRALAKLKLGKTEEAIKDFIKVYDFDNNNELKEFSKNQLISLAQEEHIEAIEFCNKHNIEFNDNKE